MTALLDYTLERTVDPTLEPIGLAAAKIQCAIEEGETQFDGWFESRDGNVGAIQAAREMVETDAQLALMPQTWRLKIDHWPCGMPAIDLHVHPVQSISSVTYLDENGDSQTWSADNYELIRSRFRSTLLKPDADVEWPTVSTSILRPITITFVAGFPTSADDTDAKKRARVPASARMAMLMLLAHWFKNRESVLVGSISKEIEHSYEAHISNLKPARYS
jgi:uncharacterized phiE125 gp8 family phage protein